MTHRLIPAGLLIVGLSLGAPFVAAQPASPDKDLTTLSLEELMKVNVSVTTAARREQRLEDVAAAAYVLTADDIKRAGARTIPDALRLVPGMQVAQISAGQWAVSSRGFNARLSNKLLVLLDGRTIYSPLFSGVIWELHHALPEDIERIEVIRGPGAALWGSNAVNGVINIITRNAASTQGGLATMGAGNVEHAFGSARWGGTAGTGTHWRVTADGGLRGALERADDGPRPTGLSNGGSNFRVDSVDGPDTWHLSGGVRRLTLGESTFRFGLVQPYKSTFNDKLRGESADLLGRWTRTIAPGNDVQFQSYVSRERVTFTFAEGTVNTFDLELQHRFTTGRQRFVWGAGYRLRDTLLAGQSGDANFDPAHRVTSVVSAFVQDEIALLPERLTLTLGSRFEHHPFTGFDVQPSARLSWKPAENHALWATMSRAVRPIAIAEHDTNRLVGDTTTDRTTGLPVRIILRSTPLDATETVLATEIGYRSRLDRRLFVDVAAFHNRYDNLFASRIGSGAFDAGPPPRIDVTGTPTFTTRGRTIGAELAAEMTLRDDLRLRASYSLLRMKFENDDASVVISSIGTSPRHQAFLHASYDASPTVKLDAVLRGATRLAASTVVPGYITADLRAAWQATERIELSLAGQNLIGGERSEFVPELLPLLQHRVGPTFYAKATVRF